MRGYSEPGRATRLLRSSIGAKFLMAVTGVLLLGFLFGHLAGNLLVFAGRDAVNEYAAWLRSHPIMLWGARIGLLAVFLVHVALAFRTWSENRDARGPVGYQHEATVKATMASRTMILTGMLVFAYLVYHLLHFTFHVIDTGNMRAPVDVYAMIVSGFQKPVISLSYIAAMVLLGLHLWHGIGSAFQTLGWNHPTWQPIGKLLSIAVPAVLVVGYLSIPLAIWFGAVK